MTKDNFRIVGIGASAGGINPILRIFDQLPADTGMAFVIVQHLSEDFHSFMPEILKHHTDMEILPVKDKQPILPNSIYLNHRYQNIEMFEDHLCLAKKNPRNGLNMPIDIFFHTLGECFMDKAVGVILSGTGYDGTQGIRTIKEAGGTVVVQDPSSAEFDGMPKSAINTNLVDMIANPTNIGKSLAIMR